MQRLAPVILLLAAACSSASAGTPPRQAATLEPKKSSRKSLEGTFSARHWLDHIEGCGGGCELRTRSFSTTGIELLPNGVARAVDDGRTVERFAAVTGKRSHLTEWSRSWSGSWSHGADRLQLQFEENDGQCDRSTEGADDRERVCEPQKLKLQCERMRILLAQDQPRTAWAWVCDGNVPESAALTPLPWVFGEERVLVALDTGKNRPTARRYMSTRPKSAKKPK